MFIGLMEYTMYSNNVKWQELLPEEFINRQQNCPVVYLPMGLCEPHGQIAAFGLDTIKAEYICDNVAKTVGGIVAPTLGYHIHESGYHKPWLKEVVGDVNPRMTSMPPEAILHFFLYQLRAFSNAGFKGAVIITGHAGGNQKDLNMVAEEFMKISPMKIIVKADPELVEGKYIADHAGKYEISQLLFLRPDLVNMEKISSQYEEDNDLGRFALGDDANEANPSYGKSIMEECCIHTENLVKQMLPTLDDVIPEKISSEQISNIWSEILIQKNKWFTNNS
ncbi:MAG TPA: creatininase family protein [Anditalea sp.]|nr:creatininase family protein [Anditalea sp.]